MGDFTAAGAGACRAAAAAVVTGAAACRAAAAAAAAAAATTAAAAAVAGAGAAAAAAAAGAGAQIDLKRPHLAIPVQHTSQTRPLMIYHKHAPSFGDSGSPYILNSRPHLWRFRFIMHPKHAPPFGENQLKFRRQQKNTNT